MITKRKKNTRQQGSKTFGRGSMKKGRGAGNRGGRGMAGTGKRGDANKQTILKIKKYFGKNGFTTKRRSFVTSTNIRFLEDKGNALINEGKAKLEKDVFVINLSKIGVDKLLAKGNPTKKYKITCACATPGAIEAVKAAGGEVIVSDVSDKSSEKPAPSEEVASPEEDKE